MTENEINVLCRDIAEETLESTVEDYCDALDADYVAYMEAMYPQYVPQYDF